MAFRHSVPRVLPAHWACLLACLVASIRRLPSPPDFPIIVVLFDRIGSPARFSYYCSCPNPMTLNLTLKVTEFPEAVRQEGRPRPDEENKKKFIQIGRPVRELSAELFRVGTFAGT